MLMYIMGRTHVLLATEATGHLWSIAAYDLYTGNTLCTFKGQPVPTQCLCLRADHTLIGASHLKPLLQTWPLSKKDDAQQRYICPGRVQALAISPNGNFCVASIVDKLYIWELAAGSLWRVLNTIDQVKVIKFTDDSSHFVTGSVGGCVACWEFAAVVSMTASTVYAPEPVFKKRVHGEGITCLYVGCGGVRARFVSASMDGSCKLWSLIDGSILKELVYGAPVHSAAMDREEKYVYAGLESGAIVCTSFYKDFAQLSWSGPDTHEQTSHHDKYSRPFRSQSGRITLDGHKGAVTCLALSDDATKLASGSATRTGLKGDAEIRVWDLRSGEFLLLAQLVDTVTNLMLVPAHLLTSAPAYDGPLIKLQHHMAGPDDEGIIHVNVGESNEYRAWINTPDWDISDLFPVQYCQAAVEEAATGVGCERETEVESIRDDLDGEVEKLVRETSRKENRSGSNEKTKVVFRRHKKKSK